MICARRKRMQQNSLNQQSKRLLKLVAAIFVSSTPLRSVDDVDTQNKHKEKRDKFSDYTI